MSGGESCGESRGVRVAVRDSPRFPPAAVPLLRSWAEPSFAALALSIDRRRRTLAISSEGTAEFFTGCRSLALSTCVSSTSPQFTSSAASAAASRLRSVSCRGGGV